jgi:hypothetical protein
VELPCGYHRFQFDGESHAFNRGTGAECWLGPIKRGQKRWGVAAQLYRLRSEPNWALAISQLGSLIDIAAGWGASVVRRNLLHALSIEDLNTQAHPLRDGRRWGPLVRSAARDYL